MWVSWGQPEVKLPVANAPLEHMMLTGALVKPTM